MLDWDDPGEYQRWSKQDAEMLFTLVYGAEEALFM